MYKILLLADVRSAPEVAIATLDGRAYFFMSNLLKSMKIPFKSLTPNEQIDKHVKLVLSTRKERPLIPFDPVLCVEDLESDLAAAKILYMVKKTAGESVYIVGIDPGVRIGISAFYLGDEVYSCVVYSTARAASMVSKLLRNAPTKKRIVRIGDGNIDVALRIAGVLAEEFGKQIRIEIVDEAGTTSLAKSKPNKRSVKDLRSARLIALRRGRELTPNLLRSYGRYEARNASTA